MTTQVTEGFETSIFEQLATKLLKDSGLLTMSIGGLASDPNWDLAKPDKHAGNALKVVPDTFETIRVLHGTHWDGSAAFTHPADVIAGVGQSKTIPGAGPNVLFMTSPGSGVLDFDILNGVNPTPPPTSKGRAAVVVTDPTNTKIQQIITKPVMVNEIDNQPTSIDNFFWTKETSFGRPTNAIEVSASFEISGTQKIGEFALRTGVSLSHADIFPGQESNIIAYLARDTQLTVTDALLTVRWNLMIGQPPAFF